MSKVFVAGHEGLVGSAICRRLRADGVEAIVATRSELDLLDQAKVDDWFEKQNFDQVYLAAARVGGIHANDAYPAEFIRDNLVIQTNVIHSSWKHGVSKFLFLGSSCVYPRNAPQPMEESSLLTGPLEKTNEWYAVAKIAGIKMSQAYRKQYGFDAISVMPTNLYGPGDNFDIDRSHVLPALIRKFHDAKLAKSESVQVWGTGTPRREFLHVDDLAEACIFLMKSYSESEIINVGWGEDVSIKELSFLVKEIVGFEGRVEFDATKPDGTPRKLLNTSRLTQLGWRPSTALRDGIDSTYEWYQRRIAIE